jgi:hypothetical protein
LSSHVTAAGVLIGFESENDWFEYRLEHDPASCNALNRHGIACAGDAV